MEDVGELFTDREAALRAVDALVAEGGMGRVLVLTGVSGMGKSTVLARLAACPPGRWACAVVDAEVLVSGMVVRAEGGEDAALELLRQVGGRLAAMAPWWRRRWLRQKAAAIGGDRPWRVNVRQWAGFGGSISHSPVQVTVGDPRTQGERRGQWTGQLMKVAHAVRRRRLLLLVDTGELLSYFDDIAAEQPCRGRSYGVAGWFASVLEQLLAQMPGLRVVLAGTTAPSMATVDGRGRIIRVELEPWAPEDTGKYLARRGLPVDVQAATAVTGAAGGLPVEISWIIDILTGHLTDGHDPASALGELVFGLAERAGPARRAWLRSHVLERISDGTLRLLQAAAVLEVFTADALLIVARSGGSNGLVDADAFARLERSSYIRALDADAGQWRVHSVLRGWLIQAARDSDARQPPPGRVLPALHRAAAEYHEALAGDNRWSLRAAHHRFATGDDRHSAAWTARLARALSAQPVDMLQIQTLADAALTVRDRPGALSMVFADAHLASGLLEFQRAQYPAAQDHAEQALAHYQSLGSHSQVVRTAARLAGHAAWKRFRYQDAATHWTIAITPQTHDQDAEHGTDAGTGAQHGTPADADNYALWTALTEAVSKTGDAPRARTLLEALPETPPIPPDPTTNEILSQAGTGTPGTAVAHALSAYPLPGTVPGDIAFLRVWTTYALDDHEEAVVHTRRLLEQPEISHHHTALAHNVLARIAYRAWDMEQASRHMRQGIRAARRCHAKGCLIQLLVSDADLASRRVIWAPPVIDNQLPTPGITATAAPAEPTTGLSLTQRAESAHQRELAATQSKAAESLATELNNPHLHAQAIAARDPVAALTVYRTTGDRRGEANTLRSLAHAALQRGDVDRADEFADRARSLHHTIGNRHGEANALQTLAHAALQRGDVDRADEFADRARSLHHTIGNQRGEANALQTLADTALQRGDLDRADELTDRARSLHHTIGNQRGEANALQTLADTALQRGDVDRADEFADRARSLHHTIGNQRGEANALQTLAHTARQRGDLDQADALADRARDLYHTIGDLIGEANALQTLAVTARQRGDLDQADALAEQARDLYHTTENGIGEANTLQILARTARKRGDTGTGRRLLEEAASLYEQIGLARHATSCRQLLQEW
ncbi:tetratricopeptide repeat protein [Streptomyces lacrimifluminis]|nr:tetratricopeptide repeat protein [Streptomyces lacrimifluminis]